MSTLWSRCPIAQCPTKTDVWIGQLADHLASKPATAILLPNQMHYKTRFPAFQDSWQRLSAVL